MPLPAVSFSSACTMNRFPWRCASTPEQPETVVPEMRVPRHSLDFGSTRIFRPVGLVLGHRTTRSDEVFTGTFQFVTATADKSRSGCG
jgi:hypothetical protein